MKKRILTATLMAVVLVPLIFLPPAYFTGVLALLMMLGLFELNALYKENRIFSIAGFVYMVLAAFSLFSVVLLVRSGYVDGRLYMAVLAMVLLLGLLLFLSAERMTFATLTSLFFGGFYLGLSFAALGIIHQAGALLLVYLFLLTMATDIFAYFIGISFGKHRLAPRISPKKTIEGAVGGTILAVLIATPYAVLADAMVFTNLPLLIAFGVFISIAAQIGDLVASRLKRAHGVKDFSKILPGHGGLLDRFDSTLFAALVFTLVLTATEVI